MKSFVMGVALLASILCAAAPAQGEISRPDVIWARKAVSLTLDGVLNEPAWAAAESMTVRYGRDNGIPGSGWKEEGGILALDSTRAVIKFLTVGNQLYMGAKLPDVSIGGSKDFNRFDGLLMSLKDHSGSEAPKPPAEYFYVWWNATGTDPQPPGQLPAFIGKWATWPPYSPRTPEQIANWDAVTVVNGVTNSDAANDVGYTVEMRFNLTPMGYQVTNPAGDILEWNISVYDCDWFWPIDVHRFSSNRTWWQSPWGNDAWYSEVRIHADPDVTTSSGPVPTVGAEAGVPNGAGVPAPTIDGNLAEAVWSYPATKAFDVRFGDSYLRKTYAEVGRHRAGQYQPTVYGGLAYVSDPGDATVRWFYRGDWLYMAFDVRDQVVQYHPVFDRWDGAIVTINDRQARGPDHQLLGRRLAFQVDLNGHALPQDYLATMVQGGTASLGLALKAGTTVDTLGFDTDTGYTAELAVNLTALGYPTGLGDRVLFLGVNLLDGDSYIPITDSYGTRTWWYREYEGTCCPAWADLMPTFLVTGLDDSAPGLLPAPRLVGAYPDPGRSTTIRYLLPEASNVALQVFDVQGRMVENRGLGLRSAGVNEVSFGGEERASGVYYYRLRLGDGVGRAGAHTLNGHVVLIK